VQTCDRVANAADFGRIAFSGTGWRMTVVKSLLAQDIQSPSNGIQLAGRDGSVPISGTSPGVAPAGLSRTVFGVLI
jgi:hypothetical protein